MKALKTFQDILYKRKFKQNLQNFSDAKQNSANHTQMHHKDTWSLKKKPMNAVTPTESLQLIVKYHPARTHQAFANTTRIYWLTNLTNAAARMNANAIKTNVRKQEKHHVHQTHNEWFWNKKFAARLQNA